MAVRTYGELKRDKEDKKWRIEKAEPHVCIKLKANFGRIPKGGVCPYILSDTPDICADLHWFIMRYPMRMSGQDRKYLEEQRDDYVKTVNELERILLPTYKPKKVELKSGKKARDYQIQSNDVFMLCKRRLLGDEFGLGKTLSSILPMLDPAKTLPAVAVVQSHVQTQWKTVGFEKFTNLNVHLIDSRKTYNLPPADVYIIRYTCLSGWVDVFAAIGIKYVIFDEVQELRTGKSAKYEAAYSLSNNVATYCQGLSATPIYNYGNEIFHILDAIKAGCLGTKYEFDREWTGFRKKVTNPEALGTYLRESFLFLRRTRKEVGKELPPINKLVYTIGYDEEAVKDTYAIAKQLALRVVHGEFSESGQAAREFDSFMRKATGIAKAKHVAAFVRMLIESGEVVLLGGWHRQVYEIWEEEFADLNPVWFTGSESHKEKDSAKKDFIEGRSNLMIMSNRSGAGVEGLQERCTIAVNGELDWSPKIHDQFYSRLDRDREGDQKQVTAIILVSEFGSDPYILDVLGLKSIQQQGIIDPGKEIQQQHSDEARIKLMAKKFLENQKADSVLPEPALR